MSDTVTKEVIDFIKQKQKVISIITENKMTREQKLAIAILKEKVEKATGKRVIFESMEKTQLMTDPEVNAKVVKAIALLKSIDIDGETMEFITKQLGMDDQMLSQLGSNCQMDKSLVEETIDEAPKMQRGPSHKPIKPVTSTLGKTKVIYGTIAGGRAGTAYSSKVINLDLTSFKTFLKYFNGEEEGDEDNSQAAKDNVTGPNQYSDLKKIYKALINRKIYACMDVFGEGSVGFGFNAKDVKLAVLEDMNGGDDYDDGGRY